jgi:large repetitive protein
MKLLHRVLSTLTIAWLVTLACDVSAATRTFAPRYSTNAKGEITFVSNVNMTCNATGACATAQQAAYSTGGSTNNNYTMQYVDIDAIASTFNSSSATLSIPGGSTVAFAGLYWAGQNTNTAVRGSVLLSTPTNAPYQTVTATQIDDAANTSYQSFADVTSIVASAGPGVYTVANIQSSLGSNQYAGWTLVVVYNNASLPTRNLVVYDGYQRVASGTPPINISLSGFITPPFGVVNSKLGIVGYDGDRGSTEGTAGLLFGPSASSLTPVFNASNPQTDVFNSTISTLGTLNAGRNPDYQNNLGYDADIFSPNTPLPNNATTAAIRVQSSSETIDVGVITLATDIFVPNIKDTLTKSVTKVAGIAGSFILPGDTLEYTLSFYNAGQDGALNVRLTDPLPANVSYLPNSMIVTNTPQSGAAVVSTSASGATDAVADDIAEYDPATRRITVRAGTGASATQGGTLIPTNSSNLPSVQVKFRVTVDAATSGGTVIDNFATVTSVQQTLGGTISDVSDANPTQAGDQPARVIVASPDLTVSKVAVGSFVQGQSASYTLTANNSGNAPTFGLVSVVDTLPTGLTLTALSGSGWSCVLATATCTRSDVLAVGASFAPITVTVSVASDTAASVSNVATVSCICEATTVRGNNTSTVPTTIVSAPVLATTKLAGAPFVRGSTSTYALGASTTGAGSATNGSTVTLSDNLPGGLTLDGTPTGAPNWTCTGTAGDSSFTCTTNATIAANSSFSNIIVPVRIGLNAPTEVVNTISVSGGGAITPTSATAITPVTTSVDRAIAKAVRNITNPANAAAPNVSDIVEFTLTATNGGPSVATDVVVNDLVNAAQFTFVSANASQGAYNSATGAWRVGTLQPNTSVNLVLRATVAAAGALANTATITGTEPDPVATNNAATVNLQGQSADLSISKTVDNSVPNVGQNVSYTLTLSNAGPSAATGVEVTDLLPDTLAFVSASSPSYDVATGKWTIGAVSVGTPVTLTITAKPNGAGAITNKAEITKSDQFDPDSTPANGIASEDDQAQVVIVAQQADLSVAKAVDNPNPVIGETLVYTVTVANIGPSAATGVIVSESIPPGLTVTSVTPSQGSFAAPNWTVGTIAAGGRAVLTIAATYVGPGRVTNTASITASDQPDPTPNSPVSVTVPSQIADLSLTKSVNNAAPDVGSNVVYTVTVNNAGPDAANGVIVSDPLPAGLAVISTAPSQGSFDAVSGEWTVGSIANGGSATLQITAKVTGFAPITNIAEIKSSRQYDPNSTPNNNVATENDQASVTITPQSADLRLSKSVTPNNPTATSPTVTYKLRVSNSGPSAAGNVTIEDALPNGVTLNATSVSASVGAFNTATGVWTIPTLASGASATLTFTANVSVFGQALTNAARITGSDKPDPTPEGAATATVLGQVADLSLAKTVDSATPNVGANVSFTVTLTNSGPNAATGVIVRDALPPGLTFVSASASVGAYDVASGLWNIGAVPFPGTATLTVVARVSQTTAAAITNRAEVSASDQFDPNSKPNNLPSGENDEAEAVITPVPQADVTIAKGSPASLNPGGTATYALIVTNLGPSASQNVQVSDPTPAGLSLVTVSGAGCTSVPCSVGTLAAGESRRIELTYNVLFPANAASVSNTASVSSSTADPSLGNNSTTITTPIVRDADVQVVKTGNATVIPGETIDYEIVVTNAGPSTAASVQLSDPTLPGLTFVGAGAPCTSAVTNCALGDIAVGATVTVTVRYQLASNAQPGVLTNIATANSSGPNASPDPDSANNTANAKTIIESPRANLAISKIGPATVLRGSSINYTISINNAGPSDATAVVVNDPTPAGLSLLSVSGDCTSFASGACALATLAVGATKTIQASFAVPLNYVGTLSADAIENRATIGASSADIDPSDNIAIASTTAITPPPILVVQKTSSASFTRGSVGTYTIAVGASASAGPTTGALVTVSDTLPSGVTLNGSVSGSGWSCTPAGTSSFSCTTSVIVAAGANYPDITVPVSVGLAADATVTNTASASGGGAIDPASGQIITPVNSSADVSISKGVDRNAPTAASPFVVFTLIAENAGPSTAVAVSAQDNLPTGMTFVSATPSLGSYSNSTGAWTIGDLLPGTRATLSVRAQVTDFTSTITNNATITSSTTDPQSDNNAASATIRGQVANLSIEKTVSDARPNVQSEIDFNLTLRNAGPDAATGVEVTDLLPSGLVFVSASSALYNSSTGAWTVGSVTANAQTTLTIRARVVSPDALNNRAQITASDQFDPDSTPGNSNPSENDDASVAVFPQQSDVRLAKRVDNPNPLRGDAVTYVVELTNLGPSVATNISVLESLPPGVDFNTFVPSTGSFDAGTGLWGVASLPANARATLTLSGVFRGPGAQTNSASIAALDQFDPTPNDPVSVTIPSQIADLSLTKSVGNATPVQGSNVQFTINLNNAGPNAATSVVVNDLLPTGLSFVSASTTAGNYNASNGNWTLGSVNAGTTASLTIVAKMDSFVAVTNTARVANSAQYDPDSVPNNDDSTEDDQQSVTLTPRSADLRLSKRVNNNAPSVANPNVAFTVEVFNAGLDAASNVQVRDVLPAGLNFISSTPAAPDYSVGVWSIASLAAGARATLTINAAVTDFTRAITNTAQIIASGLPDPTPNEQASATLQGLVADLSLKKTVDNAAPRVGENVRYMISLSNTGPDAATNVSVLDRLPQGLQLADVIASQGNYDAATGVWSVGTVAVNAPVTLTLVARVSQLTATPISNVAEIRSSDQFDPNSTPNNSQPGENDQGSVSITPIPLADISVAKLPPADLNPGTNATYTIVVKNQGPSVATAVILADPGPAGLAFISASCGASFPCNLGNLQAGDERVIRTTYRVPFPYTAADPVTNVATATSSTPDPDPANNTDRVGVAVDANADLQLQKTGAANAVAGDLATYTLTVTNAGPSSAGDVTIDDPVQPGIVAIVSVNGAGCAALPCNLGTLAPNQSASVVVTVRIDPAAKGGAVVRNVANVSSSTPDKNLINNSASTDTTISGLVADLSVAKTGPANAKPGEIISFVIQIQNLGPSNATSVGVIDPVPLNFAVTAVSGACSELPCTIASINAGASASITVTGSVSTALAQGGAIANVVTVNSAGDPTPNQATANVFITPIADLTPTLAPLAPGITGQAVRLDVTIANVGGAATSGAHRFTLTLPVGAIAGFVGTPSGYTCTQTGVTLTCESSAVIAAGQSLTIPIDIVFAVNGEAQLVAIEVSGGGEQRVDNNRATTQGEIKNLEIPTLTAQALMSLLLVMAWVGVKGRRRVR